MAIEHADFDGIERLALVTGQLGSFENKMIFGGCLRNTFFGFNQPGLKPRKCELNTALLPPFEEIDSIFFLKNPGGEIVSTFDNPELVKIGRCDVIEQVQIGDETLLKFSGVPLGEACSIVLRGATEQIIGEAERSLHDALCVLTSTVKETKTVYGGGKES